MEPLSVLLGVTGVVLSRVVESTLGDQAPKLLSTAVGGILGNRIDHAFCTTWGQLKERLQKGGPPVNHDLERAVRKAWLQATLMAVEACQKSLGAAPSVLHRELRLLARPTEELRWLDTVLRECRKDLGRIHHDDYEPPSSAAVTQVELLIQPGAATPEERRDLLRARLKVDLLQELEARYGAPPEVFAARIRDGWTHPGEGGQSVAMDWFDLLCAFFLHEVKHRQEVANVVQGQFLAELLVEDRRVPAEAVLEELRRQGGQIADRLDRLDSLLTRAREEQTEGFAGLAGRLDEWLPSLALLPDLRSQMEGLTALMTAEATRTRDHVSLEHAHTREELTAYLKRLEASVEELSRGPAVPAVPAERSFEIGEQPPYHGEGIERRSNDETPYAAASSLDHWLAAFEDGDDRCRVLVIHGPSGRGKSFAAKQVRRHLLEREPDALHFWLDCSFHPPRREALSRLFAQACPIGARPEFVREFPAAFDPEAVETPEFLERLEAVRGPLGRCYLYLDDLDHAIEELVSPRSYIQPFLRSLARLPRLRVVVTSKDRSLVETFEDLLSGTGLQVRATDPELAPLSEDHSEEYLRVRQILGLLPRSERGALVEATRGEPLYLRLVEDILATLRESEPPAQVAERQRELLREIIARWEGEETGALGRADLQRDLRGLLFRYQLARLPEEAYRLAVGIAVLTYGYAHESLAGEEVLRAVTGLDDLAGPRELLRRYRIATGEGCRLDLDAARDFLYEDGRLQGERARGEHRTWVAEMHRTAAAHYAGMPQAQGPAVWHAARGQRYRQALRLLSQASPEMEAAFLFADLLQLRRAVEEGLVSVVPDGDARAENDAQLAEILYQGFDRYSLGEEAWQRAAQVAANYPEGPLDILQTQLQEEELLAVHKPAGYTHRNALAYAQANLMLAGIAFEENSADWEALAASAEAILAFADAEVQDDAFRANVLSSLGIFRNRGAQTAAAEAAYREALEALTRLEPSVPPRCRPRLERDRLRIAVNLSRTLFLSETGGPAAALEVLGGSLNEPHFAGSQEYLYGRVNACYYSLQLGDLTSAEAWLEGCRPFRSEKEGLADKWIFDYVSALEAASTLYRGKTAAAGDAFAELSRSFDYGRDRTLMALNARVTALSELLSLPTGCESSAAGSYSLGLEAQCRELCEELERFVKRGGGTKLPAVGDEPIAAETVAYLVWAVARELARRSGQPVERAEPAEWVRLRTERRFGALMYGAAGCESPLLRLPLMMRGALILRSLPLAPLRAEREAS